MASTPKHDVDHSLTERRDRRNIDAVVLQIRREIAEHCTKIADDRGQPPLEG
jgi:hypothetical protein